MLNKKLISYFCMSYLFSWIFFVLLALNRQGSILLFPDDPEHARTLDVWHAAGGLGPLVSAIITILFYDGRNGLRKFFRSYSIKKLTVYGWLLALLPVLLFGFGLVAGRIVNGEWLSVQNYFQNNDLLALNNFLLWFFPLLTYGFGEEGGWRGFALPQLQTKYSALLSTFILTFFWLGWHIPTFFYRYQLSGVMLVGFILGLFAGAILLTFLFNYTRGSLLAVSIWHFSFNLVSMIGTEAVVAGTMSTIIMILAVVIILKYGRKDLSPLLKTSVDFGNNNYQCT